MTNRYVGQTFGKLTVLSVSRRVSYIQDNGRKQNILYLNCRCECGTEVEVRQGSLKSKTISCGCSRIEANKKRFRDITSEKFGRLTAKKRTDSGEWHCLCDCGQELLVPLGRLCSGNTRSCGCAQRDHAKAMMLNKHRAWRESLGLPPDQPIASEKMMERLKAKELSPVILKRDNYTCCLCSQIGRSLHVHHIVPWSVDTHLRFCKENLVTLCEACHREVHNNNFHSTPNPILSILIQGYASFIEQSVDYFDGEAWAARVSVTPK